MKNKNNTVYLCPSTRKEKKWMVLLPDERTVHFGASGYSDYTKHHEEERMKRYIKRHKKNENWNKSGMDTAGFWSRWILWNKPSLRDSIKHTENKFNIRIVKKRNCN